jgi:large subunit ribosomal protein L13
MKYKTPWTKKEEIKREWYVVDVKDQILGRATSKIASLLIGKGKVEAVPNQDCGDYVIVVNADDIKLTREKETKKFYYRHSGYPGGLKTTRFDEQMKIDSTKVIKDAVITMLPQNKLRAPRMARLFVYKGAEHKQGGQKPIEIKF